MSESKLYHITYRGERNTAPEKIRAPRVWFEPGWVIFGDEDGGSFIFEAAVNRALVASIAIVDES